MCSVISGEMQQFEKSLTPLLALLTSPDTKESYRAKCRQLTHTQWPQLLDQTNSLITDCQDMVDSWTRLTDNSESLGYELDMIGQSLDKAANVDLSTLTLDSLQQGLEQCKQVSVCLCFHSECINIGVGNSKVYQ